MGNATAVCRCPSTGARCFRRETAIWGAARKPRQVSACLSRDLPRSGLTHLAIGPVEVCGRHNARPIRFGGDHSRAGPAYGAPKCSGVYASAWRILRGLDRGVPGPHGSRGENCHNDTRGGHLPAAGLAATSDARDAPASIAPLRRTRSHSGRQGGPRRPPRSRGSWERGAHFLSGRQAPGAVCVPMRSPRFRLRCPGARVSMKGGAWLPQSLLLGAARGRHARAPPLPFRIKFGAPVSPRASPTAAACGAGRAKQGVALAQAQANVASSAQLLPPAGRARAAGVAQKSPSTRGRPWRPSRRPPVCACHLEMPIEPAPAWVAG